MTYNDRDRQLRGDTKTGLLVIIVLLSVVVVANTLAWWLVYKAVTGELGLFC